MNAQEIARVFKRYSLTPRCEKIQKIKDWLNDNHINPRYLKECQERASNKSRIILQHPSYSPLGKSSEGWDVSYNHYLFDPCQDMFFPEEQMISAKWSNSHGYISIVNISTKTAKEMMVCPISGVYFNRDDGHDVNGLLISPSAFRDETITCEKCGSVMLRKQARAEVEDGVIHYYCRSCATNASVGKVRCSCCGNKVSVAKARMQESKIYCRECFDKEYVMDEIDRTYIKRTAAVRMNNDYSSVTMSIPHLKERYPNAVRCEYSGEYWPSESYLTEYNGRRVARATLRNVVGSYHSFDRSNYSFALESEQEKRSGSTPKRYLGTEIECQGSRDNALFVMREYGDIFHCENDGSIGEGFEIISQPMTTAFIKENYPRFKAMMKRLSDMGMKSHDTTCCGLHVHISRSSFVDERAIDRLNAMVTCMRRDMEIVARRKSSHYYDYGTMALPLTKSNIQRKYSMGHGVSVNLANSTTVEVRIFRGTLNPRTYMATIEFVNNLIDAANDTRDIVKFGELLEGDYLPTYIQQRESNSHQTINREAFVDFSHYEEA